MSKNTGRPRLYNWDQIELDETFHVKGPKISSIRVMASVNGKKFGRKFKVNKADDNEAKVKRIA